MLFNFENKDFSIYQNNIKLYMNLIKWEYLRANMSYYGWNSNYIEYTYDHIEFLDYLPDDIIENIEIEKNEGLYSVLCNFTTSNISPIDFEYGRYLIKYKGKYLGLIRCVLPPKLNKLRDIYIKNKDISLNEILYGQAIVPFQPFGYKYLGGKLLTLLILTDKFLSNYNKKYKLFYTTSLYGLGSQYDGLEPYIKSLGQTDETRLPNRMSTKNILIKI